MLDVSKMFKVGDKEYPVAFNLNVLEALQEKYNGIDAWARLLFDASEPKLSVLIDTFEEMANEGIEIYNEDHPGNMMPLVNHKFVGRLLSKVGPKESSQFIKKFVIESMPEVDESKNSQANQPAI